MTVRVDPLLRAPVRRGLALHIGVVTARSRGCGERLLPADVDQHRADLADRNCDLEPDLADRLRLSRRRWIRAQLLEKPLEPLDRRVVLILGAIHLAVVTQPRSSWADLGDEGHAPDGAFDRLKLDRLAGAAPGWLFAG